MSAFVVDCSIVCCWMFDDERSPSTDALLDRLTLERAAAPALLSYEVAKAATMALRRGRIDEARLAAVLNVAGELPIDLQPQDVSALFGSVRALATRHRLTIYDAAYLNLAITSGLPLATNDKALRGAAREAGVAVLP